MRSALAGVARRLGARFAALAHDGGGAELRAELSGSGIACGAGAGAVLEAAARDADIVVAAISGTAGLAPTYAALKPGRRIALANKESLVCAGQAFMRERAGARRQILPVDSEHNALYQALGGRAGRGRGLDDADRLRRAVPDLAARKDRRRDAGRRRRPIRSGRWDRRSTSILRP